MKKTFLSTLTFVLVIILSTVLSFSVLATEETSAPDESIAASESSVADNSSSDASDSSADETSAVSDDSASDASDNSAVSETSKEESKTESKAETSTTSKPESNKNNSSASTAPVEEDDFPWARVITLIVIVVLILVAVILAKTQTKLGLRINKFFKEYWSEIKKVSWCSAKDTAKATGIVLVFIIVAALVIGLLDLGFTKIIQALAGIFTE